MFNVVSIKMDVKMCFIAMAIACTHGYENLAFNKSTWQSTSHDSSAGSEKAVDGFKSDLSYSGKQCSISKNNRTTATWRVDLGGIFSVNDIIISYRTDNLAWNALNAYTGRFLGFSVYISNTTNRLDGHQCFHDTMYNRATIPAVVNITCPVHGQFVIYYNERLPSVIYPNGYSTYAFVELCEVEVYGCSAPRRYGLNCSQQCPTNCKQFCHIESGYCLQCNPGYKGRHCEQQCNMRKYGEYCNQDCGVCLDYKQCDHINGTCPDGCDRGYFGQLCITECDKGEYGLNCWEACGRCRYQHSCHHVNGTCSNGCDPGYKGDNCDEVCNFGYFGDDCKEECSSFCKISRDCNHVTGSCKEGCKDGWQGQDCFQIQAKEESDLQARFYGVLAGLCVCIAVIIVLTMVIFLLLRRHRSGEETGQTLNESQHPHHNINYIDEMTDENIKSEYQELSDRKESSSYDCIK